MFTVKRTTTQSATASAAGSPTDALAPLADALVKAGKTAGNEPAGDADVSSAFQLGWLMGDVLAGRAPVPDPSELGLTSGYAAQSVQLTTLVVTKLKLKAAPDTVLNALNAGRSAETPATSWQPTLTAELLGTDARFAKAYSLGRQLNGLASASTPSVASLAQTLVNAMVSELDDLSTAFPPHAARGVANSILRWRTQTGAAATLPSGQCELWRILLAGEKKATELLEPENYLDAADQLGAKLRATATAVLKQLWVWVLVVVLLFAGGVAVLVLEPKHAGVTAAGVSGVLAALGLTWKGIGGTVGKLAGKLEAPLWGAEVDGAVTDAITLVPAKGTKKTSIIARRRAPSRDYANRRARLGGS